MMNSSETNQTSSSSSWLCSMFLAFFFTFSIFFFLFLVRIIIFRLCKASSSCGCEICNSYSSWSWAADFANLCDWLSHLLNKSPTGTIRLHLLNNIITANPDNVEYILKTNFDNYPKGKPFSAILGDLLGDGIFNVDGHSWKFQRKMASLELGSVSIKAFAFDLINSEINNRLVPLLMKSVLDKDKAMDIQEVFERFSLDNICKFSFGFDPGCLKLSLPISKLATAFEVASKLSAQRALSPSSFVWKMKRFLNVGSEKELRDAIKMIDEFATEMINHRRRCQRNSDEEGRDLLSRFMGIINDDKYLRDIVVSFLLAGRDTVASALTCFFWLVSQHPEAENLIRVELDRVMGSDQELKRFDQMRQMHYLHAALYESMRLFPPVQFDSKFAAEDDVLPDGTVVKKGNRVTYHPYAMGRMERVWGSDCMEFKPQRWLRNGLFVPENPFKYPVFQAGVRVCLGKEIALLEMKCVAVAVIRQFDMRCLHPGRVRFSPGLTATMSGGLPMVVRERGSLAKYEEEEEDRKERTQG